ncbi:MAG: hypothetical protein CMK32_05750 [Porticoccaceae bacterium]|nr:hypothetical protein [Porticoccaceae bacterium]
MVDQIRKSIMKRLNRARTRVHARNEPITLAADRSWKLAICAIVKDEGDYIREWIEFHRIQGVGHFIIYDNGSSDTTLEILREYCDEGIVDLIPWPNFSVSLNPQFAAYAHCAHAYAALAEWIAFIDVDEFLFSDSTDSLVDEISALAGLDVAAIGVCRYEYGPCGHETKPDGMVVENYRMRLDIQADTKLKIKTVARPESIVAVDSAHFIEVAGGKYIDAAGNVLASKKVRGRTAVLKGLRVNHYYTKSRQEFCAKISRGRMVDKPQWATKARNKLTELESCEQVEDKSIMKFVPELSRRCCLNEAEHRIVVR